MTGDRTHYHGDGCAPPHPAATLGGGLPPGEALLDELEARGWTQAYLSELTGFTQKHISSVVTDNAGVGVQFALALERALGVSAECWMRLEADHKVRLARAGRTVR